MASKKLEDDITQLWINFFRLDIKLEALEGVLYAALSRVLDVEEYLRTTSDGANLRIPKLHKNNQDKNLKHFKRLVKSGENEAKKKYLEKLEEAENGKN